MKKSLILTLAVSLASTAASRAAISAAGDIMFTGFNSDGNDDLAFVLLNDYTANTPIYFSDNEWDGTAWSDDGETFFHWSSSTNLSAGTLITLSSLSAGTIIANSGSASFDSGSNFGLAASNEAVYVYVGASFDTATPTFITAFANSGFVSVPTGSLANTGLTAGVNATVFTDGSDIFAYTGDRSSQTSWAAYRALLAGTGNWIKEDGSGDQSINGTAPDVPFNPTNFTLAVPEPGSAVLALLGLAVLSRRKR